MNIRKFIGGILTICFASLVHAQGQINTTQQILNMRTFREGLVLTGTNQPSNAENKELLEVLNHLQESWWTSGVEQFLSDYPDSAWAASLHYDYACFCRRTGRTTKALKHFEAAWALAKNDSDPQGQRLAGAVLGNWTDLLSSLGRLEKLKELIAIGNGCRFLNPHDRDLFQGAKDSYYLMLNHPGLAYRCGTFALRSVAEELQPTNQALGALVEIPSPTNGFSMAALEDLSKKYGLNMVAVRRTVGQDLIVPSIVHWRQNHYAAILQKQDDQYLVSDPTFGSQKWIPAEVVNEEASGEFLVPAESQLAGWKRLAHNEMENIRGMGLPSNIKDKKDKCCFRTFDGKTVCTHCPTGMPIWWVSEPYVNLWLQDQPISYLTSRGEPFSFQITYKQRDGGWSNSWASSITMDGLTQCGGLSCDSYFYNSDITVDLPNGGEVEFPSTAGGGFNYDPPKYDSETRLMIQPVLTNSISQSGADDGAYGMRLVHADGSQDIYQVDEVPGLAGDYPEGSGNLVRHIDANGDTTWFQYNVYGQLLHVVDPDGRTNSLIYSSGHISQVINPYGLTAQFKYDSSGNLTNITDAQGLSSSITYDTNNYPTSLITPYGTTHFNLVDNGISYGYGNAGGDNNGLIDRSALVVDPTGATNLYMYRYDAEMVMPSNSFTTGVPTNTPLGTLDTGTGSSAGTNSAVWFRNSFYWGPMQYAHLSTLTMTNFTQNDYLLARMQHWLQDTDELDVTGYLSVERDPSQDGVNPGLMTFYDYQGKTYSDQEGTNALPSVRAWQLPDGSTHYDYLLFDYFGNITNWISTYTLQNGSVGTRTNQFIYANNTYAYSWGQSYGSGISYLDTTYYTVPDLLTQIIGTDGETIWTYGGFDTVSWTNTFYLQPGQPGGGSYATNGTVTVSSRVLPDYGANGLAQITTNFYTSGSPVTFNNTNGAMLYASYSGWNKVSGITTAAGLTTTNLYNTNGFLAQTIDEQIGRTNSFTYQANGMLNTWTNELGLGMGFYWDDLLRLTTLAFPDGSSDYIFYNIHSSQPLDPYYIIDRAGNPTFYSFDADRHLQTVTDANSHAVTYDWCGCGALTAVVDALGNRTALNYDNQGNVTNVSYQDGTSLTYHFDYAERMTNVSDAAGRSLTIGYNNQGLMSSVSNAYGLVESVAYDIKDRPIQITDANGVTVTNAYDVMDELLSRTWPDGKGEGYGYSAAGLVAYTNRDGQVTRYGLDVAGRVTSVTNANKEVVQLAYNSSGEIIGLTNGLNQSTRWQYNEYGWMTNKIDGLGRNALQLTYNPDGWAINRWTPEKGNTSYNYDGVGNLLSIAYPNSTNAYVYDADNELTNMVDAVGASAFRYTQVGQLAGETGPWPTDTVNLVYSQQLRTNLTLSEPGIPWVQAYNYDSVWRMTGVSSPAGSFGYSYNFQPASSLISGITLPNGASITNTYDGLARLTQTTLANHWGHTLDGYTYTLDPLGLRTNILRNLGLTSSSVSVSYDNIGQLTSWLAKETNGLARFNEQLGFGFDSADNLHFRTNGALSQTFTVDAASELTNVSRLGTFTFSGATPAPTTSITVNGQTAQTNGDFTFAATNLSLANGNNNFTSILQNKYGVIITNIATVNLPSPVMLNYDNNGNLTNDGTRTFGYNTENQLTNVFVPGQWRSDFIYDGLGRRRIVREYSWSGSAWTETNEVHIIYDGYLPIQERDSNNDVLVTYTRGLDLSDSLQGAGGIGGLLARTDADGSTFYHGDGAGNITALMDGQEDIVARYMYGPFGKVIGQWGSLAQANEMQFSSMPRDSLSGLSLYPFRAYEPNFQRWLNQDPIQEFGGINLYRGFNNNPWHYADPFGLQIASPANFALGWSAPPGLESEWNSQFQNANQEATTMEIDALAASALGPQPSALMAGAIADNLLHRRSQHCPSSSGPASQPMIGGLKQIGNKAARQFDVHSFKESEVGPQNLSRYNVSVDTDNGNVWLTPVRQGSAENIQTSYTSLEDVMDDFPLGE